MLMQDLIEVSREAGSIVREGFGKNFNVEFKSNETDLVTEIDKKSEEFITGFIKKKYPSHGIIAEEGGTEKEDAEYKWVIDPIDGTTNFAHGLPIFSVSIGIMRGDEIVAGVIYDVMLDELYSAEVGSGAYCNYKKMQVSKTDKIGRSLLVTGFPYNIKQNPSRAFEIFVTLTRNARGIRRLGSAALDLAYIAKGAMDGFWEVSLHPWDMCAGILLVEEAGGKISNFTGEPINIYSKQILATNGVIHQPMLDTIRQVQLENS